MLQKAWITCPRCGEKNPKSVEWLDGNDTFDCIGCGTTVQLASNDIVADLDGRSAAVELHNPFNLFGGRS